MNAVDWGVTHERFKSLYRRSEAGRALLAIWLLREGHIVQMPQQTLAETIGESKENKDSGDLLVWFRSLGDARRVEVKWLQYEFSVDKWMRSDGVFFVDQMSNYDTKEPRPDYYFYFSVDLSCLAVLDVEKTVATWQEQLIFDREKQGERRVYFTSVENVHFRECDLGWVIDPLVELGQP